MHTRNNSEHLASRNKARGDTKMHSFPCVTTPPLHFQLQLKLSQSSFQSQKVGKSSGGRQENFQQKVLLFYVSTYLPIDRSIGSAMEKEERGISASEHKYEIIFFPKRGHFDAARAPRPRGVRRGDGRTRRRLYALSGEVSSTCYFLTYFFSCTRRDLNCAARFANFLSVPGK